MICRLERQRYQGTAQVNLSRIKNQYFSFLGLAVGSKLSADKFLDLETIDILVLGMLTFSTGTAGGVLMALL